MDELIIIISILSLLITVALGFMQYRLGKKNKSNKIGMIIPIIYFAIRVLVILYVSDVKGSVFTSVIGAIIIAGIYWWIFLSARKRVTKL